MNTKTKSFSSDMTGLPALSGTAGALIAILDAVLVNGYGSTGVVSLSVTGTVATATYASGHPFKVDTVGLFAGATPAGLNGEKRILTVSANTVTFDATGVVAGAATGTITSKVAAAGWTKLFAGTNLAAYKSLAPEATGCILRVDDTGTTTARVRGFESMSDINTGSGLFPTTVQWAASGLWWSKSNAASAAARPWRIVADERGFYYFPKPLDAAAESQGNYFGDVLNVKSNDPYAAVIRANISDNSNTAGVSVDDLGYSDATGNIGGLFVARAANALGGALQSYCASTLNIGLALQHVSGATGLAYPGVDNGLMLAPAVLWTAAGPRGYFPGLRYSPQIVNTSFSSGDVVEGSGEMVGKKVLAIKLGALTGASSGAVFMDTTSDWRA